MQLVADWNTMLAMERLPPSQPFSTALPLPSPTLQSPRLAPPLCMHGGSPVVHPASLHVSLPPGSYSSMMKQQQQQQQQQSGRSLIHPHGQSGSGLSGVQTPPPYDHPGLLGSLQATGVFSPPDGGSQTTAGPLSAALTPADHEHHHGHPAAAPGPGDSARLCPPTSLSIPHLGAMTASSSASSNSTEGSSGSPPGGFRGVCSSTYKGEEGSSSYVPLHVCFCVG